MIKETKFKIIISAIMIIILAAAMITISAKAESTWTLNKGWVCGACRSEYGYTVYGSYEYDAEAGLKRYILRCNICGITAKQSWEQCNHEYSGNVCSICGHCYEHVYAAGVCIYCNKACSHNWETTSDRVVTEFGQTQNFHFHEYIDTCTICGMERNLSYIDQHSFVNGVCECGYECEHDLTEEQSVEYEWTDNHEHKKTIYSTCDRCNMELVEEITEQHTYVNGVCACGKPEVQFYCKYWSEDLPIAYYEDLYSSKFYYQIRTETGYIYFTNAEEAIMTLLGEVDEEAMEEYKKTYFPFALDYTTGVYAGPEKATAYEPVIADAEEDEEYDSSYEYEAAVPITGNSAIIRKETSYRFYDVYYHLTTITSIWNNGGKSGTSTIDPHEFNDRGVCELCGYFDERYYKPDQLIEDVIGFVNPIYRNPED